MSRPRRNQAVVIAVLAVSLCLSAAALRRYHASASAGTRASAEARPVPAPASNLATAPAVRPAVKGQSGAGGGVGPMVVFTVYDVGIMPTVARAAAGTFTIMIRDASSGTAGLNIGGQVVNGTLVQSNGPRPSNASGTVTLTTGTYTVTDVSRPGNITTLIVR